MCNSTLLMSMTSMFYKFLTVMPTFVFSVSMFVTQSHSEYLFIIKIIKAFTKKLTRFIVVTLNSKKSTLETMKAELCIEDTYLNYV